VSGLSDEEWERAERAAFRVVSIATLPEPDVELAGWHGAKVDWRSVAEVTVAIFEAGVDPLDRDDVERRVAGSQLDRDERIWAIQMFAGDPVAFYRESRRWSGGRHRALAMRSAGATRCLVQIFD
jgi:hypothetical protein